MKTTLNKIQEHLTSTSGLKKLLRSLGKTKVDDELVSIETILNSNGLDDALCCLRAVEGRDREIRHYMVWCARQVQHLMTDPRSINALDVAEKFADGLATQEELDAARVVARAATFAATYGATCAAAWAVWAATWADAGDAGSAAASAARDARVVRAAARNAQEKKLRELCAWCDQNPVAAIAEQGEKE